MSDEELEEVEEALSNDFEIGFAIKDQVGYGGVCVYKGKGKGRGVGESGGGGCAGIRSGLGG